MTNAPQVLEKHLVVYLKYNVNPDIAVFGKALGNGHPITAVIGKRVMEKAKFIYK